MDNKPTNKLYDQLANDYYRLFRNDLSWFPFPSEQKGTEDKEDHVIKMDALRDIIIIIKAQEHALYRLFLSRLKIVYTDDGDCYYLADPALSTDKLGSMLNDLSKYDLYTDTMLKKIRLVLDNTVNERDNCKKIVYVKSAL